MALIHSGQLLMRVKRQHFNTLAAASFAADPLAIFQPEPLFRSNLGASMAFTAGMAARPEWIVAKPQAQPDKHPWDIAHEHVRGIAPNSATFAAMGDVYAEPDLLQPSPPAVAEANAVAAAGLDKNYPPASTDSFSPAWHLGTGYCNFPAAWTKGATGKGVRIAHLDTGYWPPHVSTPRNIRPEQGYNFYEDNTNVVDPGITGILKNPGHGTATLALLAGTNVSLKFNGQDYTGTIGGAPDAEIVPVRIGASVVHLYTQPLAQGLDYACAPGNFAPCQVVSLSHGGLPSNAWAEAVNRCYEAGVLVVAASGDSFYAVVTSIASHFTVYPSAFNRVLTATGATYAKGPYKTTALLEMQGCWGPAAVMAKAVAGFTPNVPWMTRGTTDGWDMSGAGTSASTPQVAAACALWLQLYGSRFPVPWQRVQACREALLNTVGMPGANVAEIGRGLVDVNALLDATKVADIEQMVQRGQLQQAPVDSVSFPFWRVVFGLGQPESSIDQMYETEAAQILARSKSAAVLGPVISDPSGTTLTGAESQTWRTAFLAEPEMSNYLRARLQALV